MLVWGAMSFWGATVITNLLSAIPWIGQDIVQFVWGGFSVSSAPYIFKYMKTLLNAENTSLLELKYLLSKQNNSAGTPPLNVKIFNSRSQSAGVCELICSKPSSYIYGIRQFSSTASQRLHAKDMAWLVGFVEGDGWFTAK